MVWPSWCLDVEQDSRLAPAYFSPNYKYVDQSLQTGKNKTTVLILVFKEILQIYSTIDFCTLWKRVTQFSPRCFSSHKTFVEEPFCVSEKFCYREMLGLREGVSRFSVERFLSHSAQKLSAGTLWCFINFGYRQDLFLCGEYLDFLQKIWCLTVPKKLRRGTLPCFTKFLVSKKFMDKWGRGARRWRREGVSQYSVKNFLSHSAERFRRGTP